RDLRPQTDREELLGFRHHLRFAICDLRAHRASNLIRELCSPKDTFVPYKTGPRLVTSRACPPACSTQSPVSQTRFNIYSFSAGGFLQRAWRNQGLCLARPSPATARSLVHPSEQSGRTAVSGREAEPSLFLPAGKVA